MSQVLELPETSGHPARTGPPSTPRSASSLTLYAFTIFLSAVLLFQVQLIFAKRILPLFGGAPSVWNTCLFSFQVLLLMGYGYAHLLKSRFAVHQQRRLHAFFLGASVVLLIVLWYRWGNPLTPGTGWRPAPGDNPVWKILQLLSLSVALPFFILSTTGPLLQSWAARSKLLPSPFRLYALSNAGSLLGLLTYPFLLEWAFTIRHQAWLWSASYLLFVALCLTTTLRLPSQATEQDSLTLRAGIPSPRPRLARYGLWLAFSTCSSIILLSSTHYLCQNIAAIPLLWVLPLSFYLLTFMLAFDSDRWYSRRVFWPLGAAALGIALSPNFRAYQNTPLLLVALYCLTIFVACMVCHGELARSRPSSEHLTSFYLVVAAGGALGGTFVTLVAPYILRNYWEFHGALLGCGFLLFASCVLEDPTGRSEATTWVPVLVMLTAFLLPQAAFLIPGFGRLPLVKHEYWTIPLCFTVWLLYRLAFRKRPASGSTSSLDSAASPEAVGSRQFAWQPLAAVLLIAIFAILFVSSVVFLFGSHVLYSERNFFGVKLVNEEPNALDLISGDTVHGMQFKDPASHNVPTLYYSPESGVGTLLRTYPRSANGGHLRIGVIGMGVASLAAYARPGDYLRFYEIDPAVVTLSLGPRPFFSFLQHSLGKIEIALGDARLSLESELAHGRPEQFDILVVDAFNSDSIPVHLLTQESVAVYQRHLRGPDSVLAFNVSNRYLDLAPVAEGLAAFHHLAVARVHIPGSSDWILLSANPSQLQIPGLREVAKPPQTGHRPLVWTDDYSNVLQVLRRPHF